MAIRVRTVRNTEELALAMRGIGHYFGWAPTAEQVEPMLSYLPLDRMHAALKRGSGFGPAPQDRVKTRRAGSPRRAR